MSNANEIKATNYVIKISKAKMPGSCWGTYYRIAVIETDGRDHVSMISDRAKGVRRIVSLWGPVNRGRCSHLGLAPRNGHLCAFERALAAAKTELEILLTRGEIEI